MKFRLAATAALTSRQPGTRSDLSDLVHHLLGLRPVSAAQVLQCPHGLGRRAGVELERSEGDVGIDTDQCLLQVCGPDVAPRAHDVGPDLNMHAPESTPPLVPAHPLRPGHATAPVLGQYWSA